MYCEEMYLEFGASPEVGMYMSVVSRVLSERDKVRFWTGEGLSLSVEEMDEVGFELVVARVLNLICTFRSCSAFVASFCTLAGLSSRMVLPLAI